VVSSTLLFNALNPDAPSIPETEHAGGVKTECVKCFLTEDVSGKKHIIAWYL